MLTFALKLVCFVLEFVPDRKSNQISDLKQEEKKHNKINSPEAESSYPSQLLLSWASGLLLKGFKTPLGYENLFGLKPEDTAFNVNIIWNKLWMRQMKNKGERASVLVPLLFSHSGLFLQGTISKLLYTIIVGVCMFVMVTYFFK